MNIETIIEGRMWIVRNMIPKELCKHVAMEYHMMKDVIKWQYPNADLGDPTMPGAWSMYCPVCFEALGQYQQPIVEKIIGNIPLLQTFCYGRLYVKGTSCVKHRDRMSGEWVGNICVSEDPDYPWAMQIIAKNKKYEIFLNEGDSCIFRGHEDLHWREIYEGEGSQIQCFVSYVEQNGEYARLKYDGRPMLAAPWESASEEVITCQRRQNNDVYYGPAEGPGQIEENFEDDLAEVELL